MPFYVLAFHYNPSGLDIVNHMVSESIETLFDVGVRKALQYKHAGLTLPRVIIYNMILDTKLLHKIDDVETYSSQIVHNFIPEV